MPAQSPHRKLNGHTPAPDARIPGPHDPQFAAPGGPRLSPSARPAGADAVALSLRGYLAFVSGDVHDAAALLDRAAHELRAQRRRTRLGQVLALAAHARLGVSDLERAWEDGEEAAALCGQVRQPLWGALARTALARVAALRGDEAGAERHAAAAERVALRVRGASVLAVVQQARGELALGAGRPAEAFAHLRRPFDPTDPAYDPDSALDHARRPRRGRDDRRGTRLRAPPPCRLRTVRRRDRRCRRRAALRRDALVGEPPFSATASGRASSSPRRNAPFWRGRMRSSCSRTTRTRTPRSHTPPR